MGQTVKVSISIDTPAFEEKGPSEVSRILRALADDFDCSGFYQFEKLKDANGEVVGEVALEDGDTDLDDGECRHKWVYTGTAYGGDDERWHGEGRCYCSLCGADGDA